MTGTETPLETAVALRRWIGIHLVPLQFDRPIGNRVVAIIMRDDNCGFSPGFQLRRPRLNRLGYRTGMGNTWTEKRVQHVRHSNGIPACPPPDQRLSMTMQLAADALRVTEMFFRRLIARKRLFGKTVVKFAPWMIERTDLELSAVRKEIRRVREGCRSTSVIHNDEQDRLFRDAGETLNAQQVSTADQDVNRAASLVRKGS